MTSQRAPPELNGFGKTTWTPGLTRSSQVLMCFGLPLRRTNTTTDFETMPWYGLLAQFLSTSFADTSRSMSVAIEKLTTSAGRPAATALLCTSEAAKEFEKETPWPYPASSFGKTVVGIEYPTTESEEPCRAAEATLAEASAARTSRRSTGRRSFKRQSTFPNRLG